MINFLEKAWLMIAIVCVVLAIYKSIFIAPDEGMFFGMFAVLATVLYLLRRRMRRRMENYQQDNEQ